jgi:hypothetical protein
MQKSESNQSGPSRVPAGQATVPAPSRVPAGQATVPAPVADPAGLTVPATGPTGSAVAGPGGPGSEVAGPVAGSEVAGPVAGSVAGSAVAGPVAGPAVAGSAVAGPTVAGPGAGGAGSEVAGPGGPATTGAEMVAVAVLATATKVGVKPDNPVNPEPKQNTRIKTLFLDNLHLFFGDTHLVPIKNFINPSHELIESRRMSGMNEYDREDYEHDRLIKLLKTMFFRESNGIVSKVFVGGGITIDQLKKKIKKGISLIVPKY